MHAKRNAFTQGSWGLDTDAGEAAVVARFLLGRTNDGKSCYSRGLFLVLSFKIHESPAVDLSRLARVTGPRIQCDVVTADEGTQLLRQLLTRVFDRESR